MIVVHVTTVPQTLWFLRGQAAFLGERGYEVHAVSSEGDDLTRFAAAEGVTSHAVNMHRAISPLGDLFAITRLYRLFKALKPGIVHAHTPKGGLLGMVAATLAGVPARVYHIHGLPMMTATGMKKRLLWCSEWMSCRLAHTVLCVSRSVRDVAVAHGLVGGEKVRVLCDGSINGVDSAKRFRRDEELLRESQRIRAENGIQAHELVVGFVGRVVRDKGIVELEQAWNRVRRDFPSAHLLIVGPQERQDPVPRSVVDRLMSDPRVHMVGQDMNVPRWFGAMDVLALPTYREGFVVTALEASAMELPIVATDVPGCRDAVVNGQTGILVPAYDADALARALSRYLSDASLRMLHGAQGRARCIKLFGPERLWQATVDVYGQLGEDRGVAIRNGINPR